MQISPISYVATKQSNLKIKNNMTSSMQASDSVSFTGKEDKKSEQSVKAKNPLLFYLKLAAMTVLLTLPGCAKDDKTYLPDTVHGAFSSSDNDEENGEIPNSYKVQKGDSLWQISQNLFDNSLSAKQTLIVVDVISKNNQIDENGCISVGQKLNLANLKNAETQALIFGEEYEVQKGDRLWQIVRNIYGDDLTNQQMQDCVDKIIKGNELSENSALSLGDKIDLSCLFEQKEAMNEEIHFRYGQPLNLDYPTQEAQNKAQILYEKAQKSAIQTSRPRTAPSIDAQGQIIANEQFYKATNEGPLSGYTIMVNSGHGGYNPKNMTFDPGAINEDLNLEEWIIALDYAEALTEKLLAQGANVLLTQGQVFTLADSISDFSENYGVNNNSNLKFVSLHCNANDNRNAKGTMFYYSDINDDDNNCEDLSNSMYEIAKEKGINMRNNINQSLLVCREANKLGIENTLVEIGFISNEDDAELMTNNPQFKEDMLSSIVEGLIDNIA